MIYGTSPPGEPAPPASPFLPPQAFGEGANCHKATPVAPGPKDRHVILSRRQGNDLYIPNDGGTKLAIRLLLWSFNLHKTQVNSLHRCEEKSVLIYLSACVIRFFRE